MAKFSQKVKGKEVGQAAVYAEPHTMTGKRLPAQSEISGVGQMDSLNIGVGTVNKGNTRPTKTDGIKIRGTGAATKGVMARGPMG
jgi:hypothetical protein